MDMENFTFHLLEKQYENKSALKVIAEYICLHSHTAKPLPDLYCEEFPIKHTLGIQIFVFVAFTSIIMTSVVGNCIVMWIIAKHKVMHRGFNYFLFNMALADFLIALLNVGTTWTFNFYYDWWFGDFCAANLFFGVTPTCVSVFTMTVVSCDRCKAVVNPLWKRPLTNKRTIFVITLIWLSATCIALPVVINSKIEKHYYFSSSSRQLTIQWLCLNEFKYKVLYDNSLLLIQYVIPLIILSATYARIACALQTKQELRESVKQSVTGQSKKKVVKMLAVVVTIFMVCWLPYQLYHALLERMIQDFDIASNSYMIFYWLAMSASVYNPFIYCYTNGRFRIGFRYAFRWLPWINCSYNEYRNSALFKELPR
ncbi:unnamed protein product [Thelazia callipaeda]|uniref:G_PROTEIN_RECEP_F1_2 domain-containing protein n=1 Tax=Thelazia callipaeda TaxID=103827 RepID=A0A0N5CKE2_THECL|nr:unnamed protein product [Thelazia callipaeda]